MSTRTLQLAALLGALTVGVGAFGAHALQPLLAATGHTATFETAVRYQFYHTLALLAVGVLQQRAPRPQLLTAVVGCWLGGIGLFCGSLYGLALTDWRWLGPITPLGGLLFISGWVLLAVRGPRALREEA